jgi:hypothetical protein
MFCKKCGREAYVEPFFESSGHLCHDCARLDRYCDILESLGGQLERGGPVFMELYMSQFPVQSVGENLSQEATVFLDEFGFWFANLSHPFAELNDKFFSWSDPIYAGAKTFNPLSENRKFLNSQNLHSGIGLEPLSYEETKRLSLFENDLDVNFVFTLPTEEGFRDYWAAFPMDKPGHLGGETLRSTLYTFGGLSTVEVAEIFAIFWEASNAWAIGESADRPNLDAIIFGLESKAAALRSMDAFSVGYASRRPAFGYPWLRTNRY